MIIKSEKAISENEITSPNVFYQRRKIIKALAALSLSGSSIAYGLVANETDKEISGNRKILANSLDATPVELVKHYTNYYEFSFDKEKSTKLAQNLKIDPWSIEVSGEVERPTKLNLEDFLNKKTKEYVYRLRCVEGWSMVVPWLGFPLADLIRMVKPLSSAKFVKFTSAYQPDVMHNKMLAWPYVEGLRIDEAAHPLTILAVGMYGETLPKQNGAPLRLVVPWKYGFKSIKAIVKIELMKSPPLTTWNKFAPHEYGFYANVNPTVPHSRWSQISERQLGSRFFSPRRQTEIFNGYGDQVAHMYSDMDLKHFF
jgi:methionine sulfoxide reductase catalytic subunit